MSLNIEGAMMHSKLLSLMLDLDMSTSTEDRIIGRVNKTPIEKLMQLEEEYISLLQQCQTEQEVLEKLDEKGW